MLASTVIQPPSSPLHDRCLGHLRDTTSRSLDHDSPPAELILHHSWPFMSSTDRQDLCRAFPIFAAYARLRHFARSAPIHILKERRKYTDTDGIGLLRRRLMSAALLRFDFSPADLVRWLGGDYTQEYLDFDALEAFLRPLQGVQPRPGQPPVDLDLALRVLREGSPLTGDFWCRRADLYARNLHDNHPPVHEHNDLIWQDIETDEAASFNIVVHRWLFRFIPGIHLALANIIFRKGKSRQIIDPSSRLSPTDTGAVNDQIWKKDPAQVPPVYYQSVYQRNCIRAWNTRIARPNDEILGYIDDITKAFKRIRYHPQFVALFAWVFSDVLILPVGTIFGGRASPGWFMVCSEVRAFVSMMALQLRDIPTCNLANQVQLPPPPSSLDILAPAEADSLNPGLSEEELSSPVLNTFVDDSLSLGTREQIMATINASFLSAFILFGFPTAFRPSVISETKFERFAHFHLEELGVLFNYRDMTAAITVAKRADLQASLLSLWADDTPKTWQVGQSLCGTLRSFGQVIPLGIFFSLRLQQQITRSIQSAFRRYKGVPPHLLYRRIPRAERTFTPSRAVMEDIDLLKSMIDLDPASPIWCRPIGLSVPRDPHCLLETDMSTGDASGLRGGLGGTVSHFHAMWRISNADITALGLDPTILRNRGAEFDDDSAQLHVNIGEFLAIIINVWLTLALAKHHSVPPGGWIWRANADNTSALSWMRYAARTHSPVIMALARFLTALLAFSPFPVNLQGYHIPGILNVGPDALSRPHQFPTWASVFEAAPALQTFKAYRIPRAVISSLIDVILNKLTSRQLKQRISELLTIEPRTFDCTAPRSASWTSLSAPSRRTRRKR